MKGTYRGWPLFCGVLFVLFLLSAPLRAQSIDEIGADTANMICNGSGVNHDAWLPGVAVAQPGRWWNPDRYGTGWDLVYSDDRKRLKAFLYTFNKYGHSTWLATEMTDISETGDSWGATIREYRKESGVVVSSAVGYVRFRFFRDDPSRIAARWRWNEIPSAQMPGNKMDECLSDMTRLNPTYYAGNSAPETTEIYGTEATSELAANQIFSGYWNHFTGTNAVDGVPGVVMTVMQISLGGERGKFGEAAVKLMFNDDADAEQRGKPIFVQAQRTTPLTSLPLGTDTFNLYFHYGIGYPNGYATTSCSSSTTCNNNKLVGTYTRTFLAASNYRTADTNFAITTTGAVPGAPTILGVQKPAYLPTLGPAGNCTLNSQSCQVTRTSRLQEITVNQYTCQATTPGGQCSVWVSWAGNGIGKPWRRDIATLSYSSTALDTADFGNVAATLQHGDRVQFELWSGTPGTPGATLLDKTPEVRAVGPTPSDTGVISVPPAPQISNLADLPPHEPNVGVVAGEAGVDGGAASYSIPIQVPPGRAGMQPSVTLSYSSRAGNGVAGLGWSISAGGSIHRCPQTVAQDAITRGVRLDGSDRLCLDGQRLIAVSGSYGAANTVYRTEIDSFAKVTQSSSSLEGSGACFSVQQKDGRKLTYGCTPAAYSCTGGALPRISVQRNDGQNRELSWLLSRAEDNTGNTIDYCYAEKKEVAADPGEIVLDRILYTGSTLAGVENTFAPPSRRVEFVYGLRPSYDSANDRGSSAIAGGTTQQTQRLETIRTYSPDSIHPAREYRLSYVDPITALDYSYYSGRSLLRRVEECAYPVAGGSPTCLNPTNFTWSDGSWTFTSRKFSIDPPGTQSPEPDEPLGDDVERSIAPRYVRNRIEAVGDLDGDGTREFWIAKSRYDGSNWLTEVQLAKVTADRVTQGIVTLTGINSYARASDLDGDGIAELFAGNKIYKWKRGRGQPICDGGATTCTAAADSYFHVVTTNLPLLGDVKPNDDESEALALTQVVGIADFNADGAPDVLLRLGPQGVCNTNGGGGSTSRGVVPSGSVPLCLFLNAKPGPINTDPAAPTTSFNFTNFGEIGTLDAGGGSMESVQHITDFDGNGAADVVIANRNGVQRILQLSPVSGGSSVTIATVSALGANFSGSSRDLRWMDVNGDGLDDAVTAQTPASPGSCASGNCFGVWQIQLNRGGKLLAPATLSESVTAGLRYDGVGGAVQLRYFGKMIGSDIDADGRADLLYPAHFAARICFDAYVTANQLIGHDPPKTCPLIANYGAKCLADICAAPPPEDGTAWSAHPGENNVESADAFKAGLGAYDPSIYRFNAIRFVQTGNNAFRVHVDETPVISGTSTLGNQQGRVDDYFGDGLADVVSDVTCPLRPSTLFPSNLCRLVAAAGGGPGSPTSFLDSAQTIPLQDLVSSANVNVLINENLGDGARPGLAPTLPDLMVGAVNGLNDRALWDYYPLSSSAGRSGTDFPLYTIDTGYVDGRHFLFQSSMPVVSLLGRSNGTLAGNTGLSSTGIRSQKYSYGGAMYNSAGRGFQGFRTIASEAVLPSDRAVRTTTFHQKFPLTGRVQRVQSRLSGTVAAVGVLSQEDFNWQCDRNDRTAGCPGQGGSPTTINAIHWPYLDSSTKKVYDLAAAEAGQQSLLVSTVTTLNGDPRLSTSGWSAQGNLLYQRVTTTDGAGTASGDRYNLASHVVTSTYTYDETPAALNQWWLDKLLESTQQTSESYHARVNGTQGVAAPAGLDLATRTVRTVHGWNSDRTPMSTDLFDDASGIGLHTEIGYPSPSFGLPIVQTVSGTGIAPARETRTDYSTDGYFPVAVTNVLSAVSPALNHTTATSVRASDGQAIEVIDPNGLRTKTDYDVFGRVIQRRALKADGVTALSPPMSVALTRCNPCSGVDEGFAAYYQSTVADGAPSQRIWFDILGREVKRATRSFDGRWVNQSQRYDNTGVTTQASAPYFSGETPLYTLFTYDRLNRMRSKRVPTAELTAQGNAQGDAITTYTYDGLLTKIDVAPAVAAACTAAPNLCLSMSRQHDALGRLVSTKDAAGSFTNFWFDPLGNAAAIRDANGKSTLATYNALGHRLTSNDPNQGNWSFSYNALGELLTQTDARGVTSSVTQRDGLGRTLRQERSPPSSLPTGLADQRLLDTWEYDPIGAKGQLARVTRDRSLATGSPGGSPEWMEEYTYDPASGRMTERKTTIEDVTPGGKELKYYYRYDSYYGYLTSVTYPNAPQPLTVWKRYNRYGTLSALTDARLMTPLWSMSQTDAYGKPTEEQFGYALYGSASYSRSTGQMLAQSWRPYEVPTFSDSMDKLTYGYDTLGNLKRQEREWRRYEPGYGLKNVLRTGVDQTGGSIETYAYDKLQRLLTVDSLVRKWAGTWDYQPSLYPQLSYTYDAVGNITSKAYYADSYVYGDAVGNVGFNGKCGPNALKSTIAGDVTRNFTCDANGNQLGQVSQGPETLVRSVTYDASNLPIVIDHLDSLNGVGDRRVEFFYAPDNARYRRNDIGGGVTFYGAEGYELERNGSREVHRIELGPVTYSRVVNGSTADPAYTAYQLRDRLGSTIALADRWGHFNGTDPGIAAPEDGLTRRSYDPFGSPREVTQRGVTTPYARGWMLQYGDTTHRGFTGHEHLDGTRLIHMNGRAFDYITGRFLSVDPLVQAPGNSQSLNPYSYVFNNPLAGKDPTGYKGCPVGGGDCETNKQFYNGGSRGIFTGGSNSAAGGIFVPQLDFKAFRLSNGADLNQIPECVDPASPRGQATDQIKAVYKATEPSRFERTYHKWNERGGAWRFGAAIVSQAGQTYASWIQPFIDYSAINPVSGEEVTPAEARDERLVSFISLMAGGVTRLKPNFVFKEPRPIGLCFVAGTPVHTDRGLVAIEQLREGDLVAARSEDGDETVWKPVVRLFHNVDKPVVHVKIRFDDETEESIGATPEHPFWVQGKGWVAARELHPGDQLVRNAGGQAVVTSVEPQLENLDTFNFEVKDVHTYFVGIGGVWVHNQSVRGTPETMRWKLGPNDMDFRGSGKTVNEAINTAFEKTGIPRNEFDVTKWGRDANGKSFPVEWRHSSGAEVNVDWPHARHGPDVPHVGYQTGGKRGDGGAVRGHILLDDVPYNR